MIRFIVRRILTGIPVVFGVIALVFVLARVIPGDPCRAALQEHANAATCDAFNKRFGLTEPIPIQFAISETVRPHPAHRPETGSTVHTLLHGLAMAGLLATTVMDAGAATEVAKISIAAGNAIICAQLGVPIPTFV